MEKLALKKRLTKSKEQLLSKLLHGDLPSNERTIYFEWLHDVEEIINICEERGRY